jgi:PAS domain-containing protein
MSDSSDNSAVPNLDASAWLTLQPVLDSLDHGICVWNDDLNIVAWNSKYMDFTGLDDLKVGMSATEITLAGARAGVFGLGDPHAIVEPRLALSARQGAIQDEELELPDGRICWLHRKRIPGGWVGTYTDITHLKRVESELRAAHAATSMAKARLRDALETVSKGFVLWDSNDQLTLFNTRYVEMMPNLAEHLWIGMSFTELLDVGIREGLYDTDLSPQDWRARRMAQHNNPDDEGILLHISTGRWVLATERRARSGGRVGVFADVTELHTRAAEMRELLESSLIAVMVTNEHQNVVYLNKRRCVHG